MHPTVAHWLRCAFAIACVLPLLSPASADILSPYLIPSPNQALEVLTTKSAKSGLTQGVTQQRHLCFARHSVTHPCCGRFCSFVAGHTGVFDVTLTPEQMADPHGAKAFLTYNTNEVQTHTTNNEKQIAV